MSIYTDTTQILIAERAAELRREADRERLVRAARLSRPRRRRRAARPWWRRLTGTAARHQYTRAA